LNGGKPQDLRRFRQKSAPFGYYRFDRILLLKLLFELL